MVAAFRRHALLPLDDCLYALKASIPHLTRSALHRCFQRPGISRLPEVEGEKSARSAFKPYPIGYFHIDLAEVRTEEGKLYLCGAVDRTSKYASALLMPEATTREARAFLDALVAAIPYEIHTVLSDNGIQFADLPKNREGPTAMWRRHPFDRACRSHGIEHRLTKPSHPWTNGPVERMNRTLKEATVRRYHSETHRQLQDQVAAFLDAYNFAKRLKTLGGLTPYEAIGQAWAAEPQRFSHQPDHLTSRLNS